MHHISCCEAVGSLLYLAVTTCPDIAFQIGILSQFVNNPGQVHWKGVKHIFQYLAGTRDWVYGMKVKGLEGFTDADSAIQEHRHAITGYTFLINRGAVSWSSKKQEIVTLSTAKSLLHMLPRRPFGFSDLLVKYFNCSPIQSYSIQIHKLPSHSPVTGLITLVPNTLISSIILFDSSLTMGLLISCIVLLTTWSPTHLPRHFLTSKQNISPLHSAYN